MVAAIATPRRRRRLPDLRQLPLPFRAEIPPSGPDPPLCAADGPEHIGSIIAEYLRLRGLDGPRARFRR